MALLVVAAPVPAEKVEQHQRFLDGLQGAHRAAFEAAHQQARVRERGYIQPMPDGGILYITSFEGDDPATMVPRLIEADLSQGEFGQWLFQQMQEIYGLDTSQAPPPLPQQALDSGPLGADS